MQKLVSQHSGENAARFDGGRDDIFGRIAGRYDLLCDLFSLGIHRSWKSFMAKTIAAHEGEVVLDAASGTGHIPLRILRRGAAPATLWVTDISPEMLAIAAQKLGDAGPHVRLAEANAEELQDFADNSVDVYSMSFGMKICNRQGVIREALRVLRPGGRFYCLEAARIRPEALHRLYLAYMNWCMPLIGRLAAFGDSSAYLYLLRGVHDFPDQESFADELRAAGFATVSYRNLTLGIVALHAATKPIAAEEMP